MDYNKQKLYLKNRDYLLGLNDEDLICKIIEDTDHLGIIFEKYHMLFAKKLNSRNNDIGFQTIQDIVTNSIMDLKDKILDLGLDLVEKEEDTLAKYLLGICNNNISNERRTHTRRYLRTGFENYDEENYDEESNITYQVEDKTQRNELIFRRGSIDEKTSNMIETLKTMKAKGGKCYSLIMLSLSKNYNYRVSDLTTLFKYKNDTTTRNQKYKCIQRFKKIYFKYQLV